MEAPISKRRKGEKQMATNFTEVLPVRLPEGTRHELAQIAKRRYESLCSVARKAIMKEIERARSDDFKTAA